MDKPKKIYYTMGEVAEIFDVNCSLIRFWEKKFDILKPHKNNKGNRLFTPEDLENLKLIYHLVKENGMTLAGAQKRLKDNREGVERNIEIVEKLQQLKSLLLEVRQELKIENQSSGEIVVDLVSDFEDVIPVCLDSPDVPVAIRPLTEAETEPESESTTEVIAPTQITAVPLLRVVEQTLF